MIFIYVPRSLRRGELDTYEEENWKLLRTSNRGIKRVRWNRLQAYLATPGMLLSPLGDLSHTSILYYCADMIVREYSKPVIKRIWIKERCLSCQTEYTNQMAATTFFVALTFSLYILPQCGLAISCILQHSQKSLGVIK